MSQERKNTSRTPKPQCRRTSNIVCLEPPSTLNLQLFEEFFAFSDLTGPASGLLQLHSQIRRQIACLKKMDSSKFGGTPIHQTRTRASPVHLLASRLAPAVSKDLAAPVQRSSALGSGAARWQKPAYQTRYPNAACRASLIAGSSDLPSDFHTNVTLVDFYCS
jgi:hypothetical protein